MRYDISETEPVNLNEVKEELEEIKKRDKELNFRAQKTLEYAQQVAKLGKEKADELKKKLEGLKISRLKEIHIQKIIDILPTREEDVKVVLQGYNITLTKENYKKIADTVKGFF